MKLREFELTRMNKQEIHFSKLQIQK